MRVKNLKFILITCCAGESSVTVWRFEDFVRKCGMTRNVKFTVTDEEYFQDELCFFYS